MKKTKQKTGCMKWNYGNGRTTGYPIKAFGHDRRAGFTLVELVIVIAIVIILSVISVPIYRGYIDRSKMAEGHALAGAIISAQKAYYSEHGNFYYAKNRGVATCYYPELGIDARGNKYFSLFQLSGNSDGDPKKYIGALLVKPKELIKANELYCGVFYNITTGYTFEEDVII